MYPSFADQILLLSADPLTTITTATTTGFCICDIATERFAKILHVAFIDMNLYQSDAMHKNAWPPFNNSQVGTMTMIPAKFEASHFQFHNNRAS